MRTTPGTVYADEQIKTWSYVPISPIQKAMIHDEIARAFDAGVSYEKAKKTDKTK